DRRLVRSAEHRLAGERLRDARQLEHDAPGAHDGDPALGVALARAHTGLCRLLRDRLVREDRDPDLAAALDVSSHRDTARLDLAVRDPPGLHRHDPVVAVLDLGVPLGLPAHVAAVLLAVLHPLGREHQASPPSAVSAAGVPGVSSGVGASVAGAMGSVAVAVGVGCSALAVTGSSVAVATAGASALAGATSGRALPR